MTVSTPLAMVSSKHIGLNESLFPALGIRTRFAIHHWSGKVPLRRISSTVRLKMLGHRFMSILTASAGTPSGHGVFSVAIRSAAVMTSSFVVGGMSSIATSSRCLPGCVQVGKSTCTAFLMTSLEGLNFPCQIFSRKILKGRTQMSCLMEPNLT